MIADLFYAQVGDKSGVDDLVKIIDADTGETYSVVGFERESHEDHTATFWIKVEVD